MRLRNAERRLKDEVHYLDKWSFGDSPSAREDRKASIYRLIRKVEKLGGNALKVLPYGFDYLAHDAMPDTFESVRDWPNNRWRTERRLPDAKSVRARR